MALPDPYIRRNPNDLITSGDWNDIQVQGRQELRAHTHKGGEDGTQIPRGGIVPGAIDGTLIDAAAAVTVKSLVATSGPLKVADLDVTTEFTNLKARASTLETGKVNKSGDTIGGPLTIQGFLMPSVGSDETKGILFPKDPGGGGGDRAYIRYFTWNGFGDTPDPEATKLLIGIDNDANDVLAFRQAGQERMIIANGNVGIRMGTAAPAELLSIGGLGSGIELGAGVAGKEVSAGKITYGKFTNPATLELVGGGGPAAANRKITMWSEGGAQLYGALNMSGALTVGTDLDVSGTAVLGYERSTADFNAVLNTGAYQYSSPTGGVPDTAHTWQHLIVARHSNQGNHHQLQIASTYAENDRLFFRKIARTLADGGRPAWNELATVTNGVLKIGSWTIEATADSLYFKLGASTVARISAAWDRLLVYQNINGAAPYFFFNQQGTYGLYKG